MVHIKLVRFYNGITGKYGEPFALCDKHMKTQKIPSGCWLEVLAEKAVYDCISCEEERQEVEEFN